RLLIIEDAAELQIKAEHVVQFETRKGNPERGIKAVTIRDLMESALRLRPDRIIVGEVRGPEALDLLNAMGTGHEGSMG
ncbi:ATPase, T2SS/T4P/T4SS family, partial [Streptococcus pyogenes]